jgi:hypothetical protein
MTRFVRRATPKDRVVAWSETWHVVAPSGLTVCGLDLELGNVPGDLAWPVVYHDGLMPAVIEPGDEITEMPCLGAWLACQDCRPFVAAGDRDGLAALAATHLSPAAVPSVPAVVAPIDRLDQETAVDDATGWAWLMHAGYWLHRTSAS